LDSGPLFLAKSDVAQYHDEQIALYGGQSGLADDGLLDSALAAPQNLYLYDASADLFDMAAAYAFHIAKNHAFYDGNKRTALQAGLAFLNVNGFLVETSEENLFEWIVRLTEGTMSRYEFSRSLCACSVRSGGLTAWLRKFFTHHVITD